MTFRSEIYISYYTFCCVVSLKIFTPCYVACALRENLSNQSSVIQISRDIYTRFWALLVHYEVQLDNDLIN